MDQDERDQIRIVLPCRSHAWVRCMRTNGIGRGSLFREGYIFILLLFEADAVTEMAKAVDIPMPLKLGFE